MKYLEHLNERQREGVTSSHQRTLLLAGAGSGKTRVLTRRIIKHIVADKIPKSRILALTFTNKAANEMKERVEELLEANDVERGDGAVFTGTFHSFCVRVLQKNYMYANLTKTFSILDPDAQKSVLTDALNVSEEKKLKSLKNLGCEPEELAERTQKVKFHFKTLKSKVRASLSIIDELKNEGIPPKASWPYFVDLFPESLGKQGEALYRLYETYKQKHNMLDFNDLIIRTIIALSSHKEMRVGIQSTFSAILVDEFQDTNSLQIRLLELIQSPECITTVVGDDDQSIYEWRGAKIENILDYPKKANAKVVKLEENYRSTKTILKSANAVVRHNENRLGKDLWTSNVKGDPIDIYRAKSPFEEAEWIAGKIAHLVQHGAKPSDIAILYRSNSISGQIEVAMHKNNQSYTIHGGINFWMRKEVKAVMSFVRWLVDPNNTAAIKEALSYQECGYGERTHAKLLHESSENSITLEQALIDHASSGTTNKNKTAIRQTLDIIAELRTISKMDVVSIIEKIVIQTNILSHFQKREDSEKYDERHGNIHELLYIASNFAYVDNSHQDFIPDNKLEAFLQSCALQVEHKEKEGLDKITMMTVHASKGLEFEHVIIAGLEEGTFPSFAALSRDYLEEERRLCYVAITRAMKSLSITSSAYRAGRPPMEPSQFLKLIPKSCKTIISRKDNQDGFF